MDSSSGPNDEPCHNAEDPNLNFTESSPIAKSRSDGWESLHDETATLRGSIRSRLSTRSSGTTTSQAESISEEHRYPQQDQCKMPDIGTSTAFRTVENINYSPSDMMMPAKRTQAETLMPSGRRLSEAVRQFHAAQEERANLRKRIYASSVHSRAQPKQLSHDDAPENLDAQKLDETVHVCSDLTVEIGHLLRDLEVARAHRTELEEVDQRLDIERQKSLSSESDLQSLRRECDTKELKLSETRNRLKFEQHSRVLAELEVQNMKKQSEADRVRIQELECRLECEVQNRIFAEVNMRILKQWVLANQNVSQTRRHGQALRQDHARKAVQRFKGSIIQLQTDLLSGKWERF